MGTNPGTASSDFVDTAASVLAIIILIVVPVAAITVFWLVHILPEKKEHPQLDAIKTLCILSLFFGGMLWPLAWLWAYSRPVFHKMAFGRDKHDDYYKEPEKKEAAEWKP
jgi:Kef-type K+ transport system membrane component KefB